MMKPSYTLIDIIAQDIVLDILKELSDRKGFEVIEEMDRLIFAQMVRDLKRAIVVPRLLGL